MRDQACKAHFSKILYINIVYNFSIWHSVDKNRCFPSIKKCIRFCVRKNLAFRRRKRYTIPSIKIFCIAFLNTFFLNSLVRLISLSWAGGNFWAISWKIASFKLSILSAICAVEAVDDHYSAIQYVQ